MTEDRFRFRAWDLRNHVMYYDVQFAYDGHLDLPEDSFGLFLGEDNFCRTPGGKWTVMQCTGLKDKNGKLIYEGDILDDPGGHPLEVRWFAEIGAFSFFVKAPDFAPGDSYRREVAFYTDCPRRLRDNAIIGNRYQNPELLEAHERG